MASLANALNDIAIVRGVLLQQVGTSISNEVKTAYLSILDDIRGKILAHEEVDAVRAKQIIREIKDIIFPKLDLEGKLSDLAMQERDFIISSTNGAAGADIFRAVPSEAVILAIGKAPMIEGALLKHWVSGINDKMSFEFERAINLSMLQGESTPVAAKRVADVMAVSLNQAETLVRTAISYVSESVRDEVWRDNSDVIKGYRHISTFDSRVSNICLARSGATWSMDGKGLNQSGKSNAFRRPPLHMRCRSYLEPILKSWNEIDPELSWLEELPETTRSSMDGQISSDTTFAQWLKTKDTKFVEGLLGKGRASLYLDGKITLNDLVTKNGRSVSLDELRKK